MLARPPSQGAAFPLPFRAEWFIISFGRPSRVLPFRCHFWECPPLYTPCVTDWPAMRIPRALSLYL